VAFVLDGFNDLCNFGVLNGMQPTIGIKLKPAVACQVSVSREKSSQAV
jgi:hypothetical protein